MISLMLLFLARSFTLTWCQAVSASDLSAVILARTTKEANVLSSTELTALLQEFRAFA